MNTNYVTSLELSKRLKEAGIEQKSEFSWYHFMPEDRWEVRWTNNCKLMQFAAKRNKEKREYISAFLASELGEMLPSTIGIEENKYELGLEIRKVGKFWEINYVWIEDVDNGGFHDLSGVSAETMSEAMGQMLLYLKQHNLLEENL